MIAAAVYSRKSTEQNGVGIRPGAGPRRSASA
jgi:hypothetical protein